MNEMDRKYEHEIELIDILRVIWKWKYLIVAGTLFCIIAAALASSLMAKTYRISMVIEPGILRLDENGDHISVDSPLNIKALIDSGAFNENILNNIRTSGKEYLITSLRFKVDIPKNSETLKVIYETSDPELGIRILNHLREFLQNKYSERVDYSKNEYKKQITLRRTEIEDAEAEIQTKKKQIMNSQDRMKELSQKIELLENNSKTLVEERNKFLSENRNENDIVSALLYTNTIQQNLQVEDQYRQEVHDYFEKVEDAQLAINNLDTALKRLFEEIKDLEYKMEKIQNILVVQNPRKEPIPITPKKRLNILFGAVIGLFFTISLAFFLEYLYKHKRGQESQNHNPHEG
jgi:capsular polysaccharide biosynthesis protein